MKEAPVDEAVAEVGGEGEADLSAHAVEAAGGGGDVASHD